MKTVIKNGAQVLYLYHEPSSSDRGRDVFQVYSHPTQSEYIRPNPTNFCGTARSNGN